MLNCSLNCRLLVNCVCSGGQHLVRDSRLRRSHWPTWCAAHTRYSRPLSLLLQRRDCTSLSTSHPLREICTCGCLSPHAAASNSFPGASPFAFAFAAGYHTYKMARASSPAGPCLIVNYSKTCNPVHNLVSSSAQRARADTAQVWAPTYLLYMIDTFVYRNTSYRPWRAPQLTHTAPSALRSVPQCARCLCCVPTDPASS